MSIRAQVAVGLFAGLALGVMLGLAVRSDPAVDDDATAASTTTVEPVVREAPWVPNGVRFRTTVLVPESFTVADARVELAYSLVNLGPGLEGDAGDDAGGVPIDVVARPEQWELQIEGAPPIAASTRPSAERVSFEVPDGTRRQDVVSMRVTGWRLAVALGSEVVLDLSDGARGEFADGTSVTVDFVLDQTSSKIVDVDVEAATDEWHGAESFGLRADDARWRIATQDPHRIQLIWEGGDAPDSMVLVADYPQWLPVLEDVVVMGDGTE